MFISDRLYYVTAPWSAADHPTDTGTGPGVGGSLSHVQTAQAGHHQETDDRGRGYCLSHPRRRQTGGEKSGRN